MSVDVAAYREALLACKKDLAAFINEMNCNPILLRYAWHSDGTYDVQKPHVGGSRGTIRTDEELSHGANAGLDKARGYIAKFKEKYPILSWEDIIQMGGALSVELAGGPKIDMTYGRKDCDAVPPEGNLPSANAPFPKNESAPQHLRSVFYRMGFSDQDIVALSGAHTIGRAFKERSGTTSHGYGAKGGTKYTGSESHVARGDGKSGVGMLGGQSWTKNWLTFDNSYFTSSNDSELLMLDTDRAIREDPRFKPYFEKYAQSQDAFFTDYASAHKRLSELGAEFVVPGGIKLDDTKSRL